MKKEENSKKTVAIFFAIFFLVIILLLYGIKKQTDSKSEVKYINNNVFALRDNNRFITITSAINTYVSSVKQKEKDNIMSILDKKYVEENDINKDNVLYKIDNYNMNYNVNIRSAYQIKSYNNIYIYYVKANLIEESLTSIMTMHIREIYYKVTINENDLTFAIAPLGEKEYLNKVGEVNEEN